ncbi:unnamed protein product [Cuscuta epithymum]|uniref:F-box domain-containing protein n=1 Tax=Cuscuta epithymum TaxID=186058 RepID=A0AAV0FAI6_9ASTE|nr:unnamed protein product [Cuscuta epithymum]
MDEQVMVGVLLCLPPKAIYRFRVVSKTWNELISHPFFIERYDGRRRRRGGPRLLALFQTSVCYSDRWPPTYHTNILSVDLPRNRKLWRFLKLRDCKVINSSGGLILCAARSNDAFYPNDYYVLNRITQKLVSLPPTKWLCFGTIGLMCEENKHELAAKYIVVRTAIESSLNLGIETYSSETGVWSAKRSRTFPARYKINLISGDPSVMNGVFHWAPHLYKTMALYRPRENNFQFIDAPVDLHLHDHPLLIPLIHYSHKSHAFTRSSIEDGDMLWYSTMDFRATMTVFVLPKCVEDGANNTIRPTIITCNEWVVVYRISVSSLWNDVILLSPNERKGVVKEILLDAFVPAQKEKNNSLAVILRVERGGVYLYDLDSKSMECIRYSGRLVSKNDDGYDNYSRRLCPYLEPFSLSAYALN